MASKNVSDKKILEIMQDHQGFREALQEHRPDVPLMTDDEFLESLRAIVPRGKWAVTGRQAAAIYQLRRDYERIPPGKNGLLNYDEDTVRQQVRNQTLRKLDSGELQQAIGVERTWENWYYLDDILKHPLGRWPAGRRNLTRSNVLKWWKSPEELESMRAANATKKEAGAI